MYVQIQTEAFLLKKYSGCVIMTCDQGLKRYAVCLRTLEVGTFMHHYVRVEIFPYNIYRVFALGPPLLLLKTVYVGQSNYH